MGFCGYGGKGEFGEGLGNPDYGFQLTDCDGDARPGVGRDLRGVDLTADGDEVGRELFACFRGEARRAASKIYVQPYAKGEGREILTIYNS